MLCNTALSRSLQEGPSRLLSENFLAVPLSAVLVPSLVPGVPPEMLRPEREYHRRRNPPPSTLLCAAERSEFVGERLRGSASVLRPSDTTFERMSHHVQQCPERRQIAVGRRAQRSVELMVARNVVGLIVSIASAVSGSFLPCVASAFRHLSSHAAMCSRETRASSVAGLPRSSSARARKVPVQSMRCRAIRASRSSISAPSTISVRPSLADVPVV